MKHINIFVRVSEGKPQYDRKSNSGDETTVWGKVRRNSVALLKMTMHNHK